MWKLAVFRIEPTTCGYESECAIHYATAPTIYVEILDTKNTRQTADKYTAICGQRGKLTRGNISVNYGANDLYVIAYVPEKLLLLSADEV